MSDNKLGISRQVEHIADKYFYAGFFLLLLWLIAYPLEAFGEDDKFTVSRKSHSEYEISAFDKSENSFWNEILSVLKIKSISSSIRKEDTKKIVQLVIFRNNCKDKWPIGYKLFLDKGRVQLDRYEWTLSRSRLRSKRTVLSSMDSKAKISHAQCEQLFRLVDNSGFWTTEAIILPPGDDGARWLLECYYPDKGYKAVVRWNGGDYKVIGDYFDQLFRVK